MSTDEDIAFMMGPREDRLKSGTYSAEYVRQYTARTVKADLDSIGDASWPETDLRAIYASGLDAPNPDVLMREDGSFLLYSGLANCIFGEASAGKTAMAQWAASRELLAGRHVYLVDYETTVRIWLARFRALGVPDSQVVQRFHYLDVAEGGVPPTPHPDASLVVIDSLTAAIDAAGFDPNDAQGIEAVYRRVIDPFTDAGLAALVIDHVGHADKSRPMNSIRKTGIVQGAMYRVEALQGAPFGRNRTGESLLFLHKDNMGGVGASKKALIAKFVMASYDGGSRIACRLVRGDDIATMATLARGAERLMDQKKSKILDALADGGELKRSDIRAVVGGKTEAVKPIIEELLAENVIVAESRGNATYFRLST